MTESNWRRAVDLDISLEFEIEHRSPSLLLQMQITSFFQVLIWTCLFLATLWRIFKGQPIEEKKKNYVSFGVIQGR